MVRSYRETEQEGYQAEVVGVDMVTYPDWIARAGSYVGLPSPDRVPLELASQVIVVGPRRATDTSILENGGSFELQPYLLWNASLRTRAMVLFPHQETFAALRGKNLLGAAGPDPGFSGFEYPLAAREILLELRHRY
jgi:iron complex outermembrane receptor protein